VLNPGSGFDDPGFAFTVLESESRLEDEPGFIPSDDGTVFRF
jgi:hypothetical protein